MPAGSGWTPVLCDRGREGERLAHCRDLDLEVRPGEAWAILGTNGVGKTTLLHTLAGLRAPASGEILLGGRPLHRLRRKEAARSIGLMLQDTDAVFPLSVREAALEGLGIAHLAGRALQILSGGEKRLVAAATLFVQTRRS